MAYRLPCAGTRHGKEEQVLLDLRGRRGGRTATQQSSRTAILSVCASLLSLAFPANPAPAECVAPPALRAQVAAKPTAENYSKLGNWYADGKNFGCAATAFAAAFRRQPQTASLAYFWGLSLHSAGRENDALAPLKEATQLDRNDIRPHLVLGAVFDKLNKPADAEAEYYAALAINPDSTLALDALSQNFIDRKDYASVMALLGRSGRAAKTPLQSLNLGTAYAATAQLDQATRVLREGLNNAPDSLAIADELAVVLMLHGRDKEAYVLLESVLARHPQDQATQLLYLRILVSSHGEKAPEVAAHLLAAYPGHWEVQYLNGVIKSRDGDYPAARNFLERSIALKPDYDQSHAILGSVMVQLDDLPDARSNLEKAVALGNVEPEVEYNLARVLMRLGANAQAQEKMKIYQKLKSARADKVQAAGKAEEADQAMSEGDAQKAAPLYREAIDSDPNEAILHYKLTKALDKLGDLVGEKESLQRAIALDPNLAEAQNQLGFLTVRAGDAAGAEPYFRAAIQASPSYMPAWINLAATLASEAKWDEARKALDHALEIDPENADARRLNQAIAEAHPAP